MKRRIALILAFALLTALLSGCSTVRKFIEFLEEEKRQEELADDPFGGMFPNGLPDDIQIAEGYRVIIDEEGNMIYSFVAPEFEEGDGIISVWTTPSVTEEPGYDQVLPLPEELIISTDETFHGRLSRVPQINLTSPDAQAINQEIMNTAGSKMQEMRDAEEGGYDTGIWYLDWELIYSSPDRIALLLTTVYDGDSVYYHVYNFDLSTQTRVSNAQILEEFGLTDSEFMELAKATVTESQKGAWGPFEFDGEFYEKLEFCTSPEKLNTDMPMYVDDQGRLHIIAYVGSFAGASYYEKNLVIDPSKRPAEALPEEVILSIEETYGNVTHRVPQINLTSPDALAINQEIMDSVGSYLQEIRDAAAEGYSATYEQLDWRIYYSTPDRFALMTTVAYPGDTLRYQVYNFDLATQTRVSNAQILEEFGLSDSDFRELAKTAAAQAQENAWGSMEHGSEYREQLESVTADSKFHRDMPMFVNTEGQLCIITKVGSPAGASYYDRILAVYS